MTATITADSEPHAQQGSGEGESPSRPYFAVTIAVITRSDRPAFFKATRSDAPTVNAE